MTGYLVKRILGVVPVLCGVTLLVFTALHLIPGGPEVVLLGEQGTPEEAQALRVRLALDRPLPVQYLAFLGQVARGDLGTSIMSRLPVAAQIAARWPASLELVAAAIALAVGVGVPAGIVAGVRRNSIWDSAAMAGSLLGISIPVFWLGLLLVYLFAVDLRWLPPGDQISTALASTLRPVTGVYLVDAAVRGNWPAAADVAAHLALPAVTLGTIPLAVVARMTRGAMLEALSQDYVQTARAKGLRERTVILRHTLKNALLPVVTVVGLQFGTLLGGAILTETVFSWPGLGLWLYQGILNRDYPVVEGGAVVIALTFVAINLLVDVSYALLDPRIQYG